MSRIKYYNSDSASWEYADLSTAKSAYEYAQEGGYTGTEEEFAEKLAQPSSGGSITSSDDGNGNVILELFSGLSASDDGTGNVTIS